MADVSSDSAAIGALLEKLFNGVTGWRRNVVVDWQNARVSEMYTALQLWLKDRSSWVLTGAGATSGMLASPPNSYKLDRFEGLFLSIARPFNLVKGR